MVIQKLWGGVNLAMSIIGNFRMPLFFFVSGYIINKVTKVASLRELLMFYKKKFISLMVPTFTWSLLVSHCFFVNTLPCLSMTDIIDCFNGNSLWFLSTLFYYMLPVGLFKLCHSNLFRCRHLCLGLFALFWILYMVIYHFMGAMKMGCLYLPYFFFGFLVSLYPRIDTLIKSMPVLNISLLVFCLVAGYWVSGNTSVPNLAVRFVAATSAICMIYNLVVRIKWNATIDRIIRTIGVNTLGIYVAHWYLLGPYHLFHNWLFALLELLVLSLVVAAACIGIQKLIGHSAFLNLMFYGKQSRRE